MVPGLEQALEIFDGIMLGDGGLVRAYKTGNAYFSIALSSSDGRIAVEDLLSYLQYIKLKCFNPLGISTGTYPAIRERAYTKGPHRGEVYKYARLVTRVSSFLTSQYIRWYGESRYKEVPDDLALTPVSLAHLFAGDGSSSKEQCSPSIHCNLSTPDFSIHSVETLERQLRQLGIISLGRKHQHVARGSGISVVIHQDSLNDFMDMINRYIVEPYRYKLKYRSL
jgi:hypothetical protein